MIDETIFKKPWLNSNRKDGKPRKRNKYPAPCFKCGHEVPAGEGTLELTSVGWTVMCITR